jgi:uncharacterized membrane protein YedE/YeeE
MMRLWISLISGLLFGLGLAVSQMTNPLKVLGFLDFAGSWDPSLAFVMGGAVAVTALCFRPTLKRSRPWFASRFHRPQWTRVDASLMTGAAVFGIGWGLSGYCPGPAIATLFSGNRETWWFLPAMFLGGLLQRWQSRRTEPRR